VAGEMLIDISAALNQGAGIGRYARQLTRELIPLLPPASTRLWYAPDAELAHPDLLVLPPWNAVPVSQSRISRRNVDRFHMRARLPLGRFLGSGSPLDSYSPDFTTPPGTREHITIHDLAWLHPEAQTPPGLARFLAPVARRAIERSTTVFTVSETIRSELLNRFAVDENRVVVATNAAATHFFETSPLSEEELVTLELRAPYLLYVGTIEPRKNIPLLVRAMACLPRDLNLVIVGKRGWEATSQLAQIDHLGLQSRVVLPGYITEELLARTYASAAAVVYPSRYEGFGLPIVEGLASGVPVVASDIPVFREVGGNEVFFFDPTDSDALTSAIEQAITSAQGSIDARVRRQAQARPFDWQVSASVVSRRLQEAS
jgi:glycosyltransferase involved in cell wall biosynthesis